MAVNSANEIHRMLDGEMQVPRVTGPIIGALAIAIALLVIVLSFQAF